LIDVHFCNPLLNHGLELRTSFSSFKKHTSFVVPFLSPPHHFPLATVRASYSGRMTVGAL